MIDDTDRRLVRVSVKQILIKYIRHNDKVECCKESNQFDHSTEEEKTKIFLHFHTQRELRAIP